jgi:hypothetical protein
MGLKKLFKKDEIVESEQLNPKVVREIKSLEKEGYFLIHTGNMFIEENFTDSGKFNFFHWLNSLTQSHDFHEDVNGKFVRLVFKIEEVERPGYYIESLDGQRKQFIGNLSFDGILIACMKRFGGEKYRYYKLWIADGQVKRKYLNIKDYKIED